MLSHVFSASPLSLLMHPSAALLTCLGGRGTDGVLLRHRQWAGQLRRSGRDGLHGPCHKRALRQCWAATRTGLRQRRRRRRHLLALPSHRRLCAYLVLQGGQQHYNAHACQSTEALAPPLRRRPGWGADALRAPCPFLPPLADGAGRPPRLPPATAAPIRPAALAAVHRQALAAVRPAPCAQRAVPARRVPVRGCITLC